MPFAEIFSVRYHYQITGDGPALVLLHGFTGSSENWQALAAKFSAQYRVITIDLLGHGQTESPPNSLRYTMEETAADLVELLNQIHPAPVNLLGYSMGGRLALFMALRYPARFSSLILEGASPGLQSPAERDKRVARDYTLAGHIERDGIKAFVQYWEALPLFWTQQNVPSSDLDRLHQQRLNNTPKGLANSLRGMGVGSQPSLWEDLPKLQPPVLLLTGALDSKFVEIGKQMQASIPGAQLVIIPDAGHTIHLEQAAAFTEAVLAFLGSQPTI